MMKKRTERRTRVWRAWGCGGSPGPAGFAAEGEDVQVSLDLDPFKSSLVGILLLMEVAFVRMSVVFVMAVLAASSSRPEMRLDRVVAVGLVSSATLEAIVAMFHAFNLLLGEDHGHCFFLQTQHSDRRY